MKDNFQIIKTFSIDKDFSNLKSLEKAEILITDNSAIVFEYFYFKRPVIYIEYSDKIHNLIENLKEFGDIFGKHYKKITFQKMK